MSISIYTHQAFIDFIQIHLDCHWLCCQTWLLWHKQLGLESSCFCIFSCSTVFQTRSFCLMYCRSVTVAIRRTTMQVHMNILTLTEQFNQPKQVRSTILGLHCTRLPHVVFPFYISTYLTKPHKGNISAKGKVLKQSSFRLFFWMTLMSEILLMIQNYLWTKKLS